MIQVSGMGKGKEKVYFTAGMTAADAIAKAKFQAADDSTITLNGQQVVPTTVIEKDGSKVVITPKVSNG